MDPLQILKTEWPVITGAPTLMIGFCIVVAIVAWWVTKQFSRDEIAALKERLTFRDEQIADVREKLEVQKIELTATTARLAEFRAEQAHAVPPLQIAATTTALVDGLARLTTTNAELYTTVSSINFSGESGLGASVVRPTPKAEE